MVTRQTDEERTRRAIEAVERKELDEKDRHRQEWLMGQLDVLVGREVKAEPVTAGELPAGLFTAIRDHLRFVNAQNKQPHSTRIKDVHEFTDGYNNSRAKRVWMQKHRREMARLDQLRNLVVQAAKQERIVTWHTNHGHHYGALVLSAPFLCALWGVSHATALKTMRFLLRNGFCVRRERLLYATGDRVGYPLGAVYLFGRRTVAAGPLVPKWSWVAPKTKVLPDRDGEEYPAGPLPEWIAEVNGITDAEVYVPALDKELGVVTARLRGAKCAV